MHVVDAQTLKEIPIESLEQAVLSHVQSNIEKYADHFVIKLVIDGKEYVQRVEDDSRIKATYMIRSASGPSSCTN